MSNRSTDEILKAARALIADKRHYFMGGPRPLAWTDKPRDCTPNDPDAVRWNAWGAVERASEGSISSDARRLLNRVTDDRDARQSSVCKEPFCCQPHEVVLEILDAAIAEAAP